LLFTKRILILIVTIFIFENCTPVQQIVQDPQKIILSKTGFITNDVFQVQCRVTSPPRPNKRKLRKRLITQCRRNSVSELAKFSIQYDAYAIKKWEKEDQDKPGSSPLQVTWLTSDLFILMRHYKSLLPGHIVYEKETKEYLKATYRITSPDLMNSVIQMSVPRFLRNRYIKTNNETNLKKF